MERREQRRGVGGLLRCWVLTALLSAIPGIAGADLYYETVKVVKPSLGDPVARQTVRHYLKTDLSRMDIGSDVVIADFRTMTGYVLNNQDRVFLKMDMANVGRIPEGLASPMKATATTEQREIHGYPCRRYVVEHMGQRYEMWLSKAVKGYAELRSLADRIGPKMRANPLFHMGIVGRMDVLDGFPVRTVIPMPKGATKIITLKRVSCAPLKDTLFQVPKGFSPPY